MEPGWGDLQTSNLPLCQEPWHTRKKLAIKINLNNGSFLLSANQRWQEMFDYTVTCKTIAKLTHDIFIIARITIVYSKIVSVAAVFSKDTE